ncbi:hypothetical protein ACN2XU_02645 [Primorskyibacter sp. 2E107]|uniref:hypothetical protein n=1 Tax=Primorskyibacter sp. 2E107 TaxID=3403458 RepID=UPI003AF95C4A
MVPEIGAFFHSSLSCAGAEIVSSRLQSMAADTAGHFGLAVVLAAVVFGKGWPRAWVWVPFALLCLKEGADYLREPGLAVALDCVWDVATYLAGIGAGIWAMSGANVRRGGGAV